MPKTPLPPLFDNELLNNDDSADSRSPSPRAQVEAEQSATPDHFLNDSTPVAPRLVKSSAINFNQLFSDDGFLSIDSFSGQNEHDDDDDDDDDELLDLIHNQANYVVQQHIAQNNEDEDEDDDDDEQPIFAPQNISTNIPVITTPKISISSSPETGPVHNPDLHSPSSSTTEANRNNEGEKTDLNFDVYDESFYKIGDLLSPTTEKPFVFENSRPSHPYAKANTNKPVFNSSSAGNITGKKRGPGVVGNAGKTLPPEQQQIETKRLRQDQEEKTYVNLMKDCRTKLLDLYEVLFDYSDQLRPSKKQIKSLTDKMITAASRQHINLCPNTKRVRSEENNKLLKLLVLNGYGCFGNKPLLKSIAWAMAIPEETLKSLVKEAKQSVRCPAITTKIDLQSMENFEDQTKGLESFPPQNACDAFISQNDLYGLCPPCHKRNKNSFQ